MPVSSRSATEPVSLVLSGSVPSTLELDSVVGLTQRVLSLVAEL